MAARVIEGSRGGKVLIYNGYKYHKNRQRTESIFWRCWRTECRANLRINIFDLDAENPNIVIEQENDHTHEEDLELIGRNVSLNRLRSAIREDPTVPIKRVYDRVARVMNRAGGDREHIPEFRHVRTSMTRARLEHVPPVPHNVNDVIIENAWRQTWSDDDFFLHQDNDWGLLVFATEENLVRLQRCPEIFMDETFRTTPRPYNQYFTVHGKFQHRVLCFVHVLMTGKLVGQYRKLFRILKRAIRRASGHRWRPALVISDFEQALMAAIETEIPTARISGCYFHLCQSLWRKVQSLGLSRDYRQHRRLQKIIRKVMAMGYLPLALVRHNFRLLTTSPRTRRLQRRFPELMDFFQYFERNYLNGTFSPQMWNVYDRDMDTRTNNHVESYHRQWNTAVSVRHPSIWTFIRCLKDEKGKTETSADAANRGDDPPTRRRKWRDLERRLQRLKQEYHNGARNLEEYWEAVCHCVVVY